MWMSPVSSQSEQQWVSNKDNKVILVPLSQWDRRFVVTVALGNRDRREKATRRNTQKFCCRLFLASMASRMGCLLAV